jgi:hypothetical protein
MSFGKRMGLWLSASFFSVFLLAAVWSSVGALTIGNRHAVKNWLKQSNAYSKIVDVMLDSVKSSQTSEDVGTVPVDKPEIRTIAENAFNATLLQQNTEKFLDGTYNWLDGKTPQPVFSLDFSGAKKQLAEGIGNYVKTRLAGLPVCPAGTDLSSYDLFNDNCRPLGVDPTAQGKNVTDQLLNDQSFLPNPVVTPKTLTIKEDLSSVGSDSASPTVNLFQQSQIKQLPKYYRWSRLAPFVFGILVLICVMLVLWSSPSMSQGFSRVGFSLIWTGGLLIFSVFMFSFASGRLKGSFGTGQSAELKVLTSSLIDAIFSDVNNVLLWFGISFAAVGSGALFLGYTLRKRAGVGEYNLYGEKLAPKESPAEVKELYKKRFRAMIDHQKELAAMAKSDKTDSVADIATKSHTSGSSAAGAPAIPTGRHKAVKKHHGKG